MSLAYQDISKQQQKRAANLKNMDPKKAEQVERLGMGFGMRRYLSIRYSVDKCGFIILNKNPFFLL